MLPSELKKKKYCLAARKQELLHCFTEVSHPRIKPNTRDAGEGNVVSQTPCCLRVLSCGLFLTIITKIALSPIDFSQTSVLRIRTYISFPAKSDNLIVS